MAFYYTSLLSIVPLGAAYAILALLFAGAVRATRGVRGRGAILSVLGIVFLVMPVSEEFWIARDFGQACKEAGTFIDKKVQVEGFYDDTRSTHAGTPTPQAAASFEKSGYQFLEMKGREKFVRVEKIDGQWRSTALDRPTARYHFRHTDPMSGTPWGHKIIRSGSEIVDSETNQAIARYVSFGRSPPWFFVWLDTPSFACDAPGRWPLTRGGRLIYSDVLIPTGQR